MRKRVLTVEDLRVSLPVPAGSLRAVQGVSFHVDRGETLCIVGESGCGKSLTALAIMGLLPAHADRRAARLDLEGQDLTSLPERAMSDIRGNRMAMIFQEPMTSLNPAYSIGDQLAGGAQAPQARVPPARTRPCHRAVGARRDHGGHEPAQAIPTPALGRPAPARHDRHGPDVPAGADPGG